MGNIYIYISQLHSKHSARSPILLGENMFSPLAAAVTVSPLLCCTVLKICWLRMEMVCVLWI